MRCIDTIRFPGGIERLNEGAYEVAGLIGLFVIATAVLFSAARSFMAQAETRPAWKNYRFGYAIYAPCWTLRTRAAASECACAIHPSASASRSSCRRPRAGERALRTCSCDALCRLVRRSYALRARLDARRGDPRFSR